MPTMYTPAGREVKAGKEQVPALEAAGWTKTKPVDEAEVEETKVDSEDSVPVDEVIEAEDAAEEVVEEIPEVKKETAKPEVKKAIKKPTIKKPAIKKPAKK